MNRSTRIVCTIGPSSASPAVLRKLLKAGMDVARLNFSHGDHASHRQAAADVRAAAEDADRPVALLGDLQGPKIRTGGLETGFQRLVRGRRVFLIGGKRDGENEIEVSHPELVEALHAGDRVLLDDGRIELVVRSVSTGRADCSIVRGGLLGERNEVHSGWPATGLLRHGACQPRRLLGAWDALVGRRRQPLILASSAGTYNAAAFPCSACTPAVQAFPKSV